jgi:hypothetical protein
MIASDREPELAVKPRLAAIARVEKDAFTTNKVAIHAIKRAIPRHFLSQNGDFCAHP